MRTPICSATNLHSSLFRRYILKKRHNIFTEILTKTAHNFPQKVVTFTFVKEKNLYAY